MLSRVLLWAMWACGSPFLARSNVGAARAGGPWSAERIVEEKPSAMKEADRLGIWFPASDFEPIGVYLAPGEAVEVDVRRLSGAANPTLLVGAYSRNTSGETPSVHALRSGKNIISDHEGGLLFTRYVTDERPVATASVRVRGGELVPFFRLGETAHDEWLRMLETRPSPDVVLVSEKTMVVVSRETALAYRERCPSEILSTLDRIAELQDAISGIDGSTPLHRPNAHKLLITELAESNPGFYMAAREHRVMIPTKNIADLMDPAKLSNTSWGLWHEMGHHRQMVNWDWDEVDEVTVNIYSLASLYGLPGEVKWLKGSPVWDECAEFFAIPLKDRDYNTSKALSGKGRLAMFRQLWLAYGDEFYIRLHQLAREDNAGPNPTVAPRYQSSREEKMAFFIWAASKASGRDLKDFFTRWGFQLPEEAFFALDALNLPAPEEDLTRLRE